MATRAALVVASYITVLYDVAKADLTDTFTEDYIATLTDIDQDTAEVGWYWNGAAYQAPATPIGELTDEQYEDIVGDASSRSVSSVNVTIQAETAARNLAIADLQSQIDTLGKTVPVNAQTGTSYTILNTDQGYLVTFSNGSAVAVTLPQATGDFGDGYYFFALNKGAGTVTITPTTSTIGGAATLDLDQDSWALVASDGTNYQVLIGGGSGGGGVTSFEGRTGAISLAAGDLDGALWTVTDVASGATTNIGAAATMMVRITGTTGISAFDTVAAGILRVGYFADVVAVTHNATSMILPSGANITTAANARFAALSLGSGNWLWLFYQPTNGKAIVAPSWSDITSKPTTISGFGITDAYSVGGTDVALADGGTGVSLADPNADRIMFWDDSAGAITWLEAGSGLTISGTTITSSAAPGGSDTHVQYNDGGAFGGEGTFTYNKTTNTLTVQHVGVSGRLYCSGAVVDTLSADQNDYTTSNLSTSSMLILDPGGADRKITGLEAPASLGTFLRVVNAADADEIITLVHESSSSTAVNRFSFPRGENIVIPRHHSVLLQYYTDLDTAMTSALPRWMIVTQTPSGWYRRKLASDQTNSNASANTLEDVTGLSFPVEANKTYAFKAVIGYTSAATTTGSRWTINGPSSPTTVYYRSQYTLTATTETTNYAFSYQSPSNSNATSLTNGNMAIIEGVISNGANAGTVIVQHASEVSSSAITALASASYIEWCEVT